MIDQSPRQHRRKINLGDRDVVTHGLRTQFFQDIYFYTMTLSWPAFFAAFALLFIALNMLFASLYMLGDQAIGNLFPNDFLGAFFFSVETLATVGYGDMHPQTVYGHLVATVEIFIGMSGIALITGVMFSRFSRPRSSIVFADHPVSHEAAGRKVLMIRMANARMNMISEASAKLRLIRTEKTQASGAFRKIHDLTLEREQHPMFVLGWTLIHVIDKQSALFGESAESLKQMNAALILSVEGVDETTSQTQRARHYYPCELIRWNHRYADIMSEDEEQTQHIHYSKFHESEEVTALPRGFAE